MTETQHGKAKIRQPKPKALSEREKYRRIGSLTDTQRGMMVQMIKRSRDGLWTRYSDFMDVDCPWRRMCEMIDRPELGIKMRYVAGKSSTGSAIYFSEFCVTEVK